ncbi:acetyltransferase [Enterococcus ureilyticus]|uniref:Acetyltransferase n=1 Tax=Enterococcus ureilyticus TaxID=1131292 RepID=A0A1E5HE36_9ENTE|nr:DapH/DapD/GlmU-related protein [Enterococcus ureilyticus]MBM7690182.1 acetyltransferase-like isoleucine patch superfamily enzyme [Enterococcus ureilyticus]MBO0447130.1 sugar O-acetyltransferase [Enterococcus ureilyticus]OEG22890.1 acetyltransferase [Enterococcus ureilyticus]
MSALELQQKIIGKEILKDSPLFKEIHLVKQDNERLIMLLNAKYYSNEEVLQYLGRITGQTIDSSVKISQPFYTDFGKHITFGKDIFINQNVTFVDLGGITIEDQVLIGPGSRLITVNHLISPEKRRGIKVEAICIKKNAWLGANVTVLPGITIGENSIVAADSTVTKDVPDNVVVVGSPAKIVRKIEEDDET